MKIMFMGTPDFAIPILNTLEKEGHEILLVVTQPDRPKGRGGVLSAPPVKQWALERGILVYQPENIRSKEAIMELSDFPVDIGVVAAFGQIIPPEILYTPAYGCINVHASLLPKYRGASPIQWSILNGDNVTGVSIMEMGPGLDDGAVIMQEEVRIDTHETGGSLFNKLAVSGGNLCAMALIAIETGVVEPNPQDEMNATYVTTINKEFGRIDFSKPAVWLERMVRALDPWPSAFTTLDGKQLKIWKSEVVSEEDMAMAGDLLKADVGSYGYGAVVLVDNYQILVKTGDGYLSLQEVQLESKKRMKISDFLMGNRVLVGQTLGE